jgi:hypothetical protein
MHQQIYPKNTTVREVGNICYQALHCLSSECNALSSHYQAKNGAYLNSLNSPIFRNNSDTLYLLMLAELSACYDGENYNKPAVKLSVSA